MEGTPNFEPTPVLDQDQETTPSLGGAVVHYRVRALHLLSCKLCKSKYVR